jgi:transposase
MSLRETDWEHMTQLAALRRKAKAVLKAYRFKVIAEYLAENYDTRVIAQRLSIGMDVARTLIAEFKRGRS